MKGVSADWKNTVMWNELDMYIQARSVVILLNEESWNKIKRLV